jgi:DNA-binding transcriptional MerR regulator
MKDFPKGQLLFKISDAAEMLGLESHVLRYWEKEFSDQIKPIKIGSRKKLYTRTDVETFGTIRDLMHGEGYSLSGAKKRLKELGPRQNKLFGEPEEDARPEALGARAAHGSGETGAPEDSGAREQKGQEPRPEGGALEKPEESVLKKLVGDIRLELLAIRDYLMTSKRYRSRKSASEGGSPGEAGATTDRDKPESEDDKP